MKVSYLNTTSLTPPLITLSQSRPGRSNRLRLCHGTVISYKVKAIWWREAARERLVPSQDWSSENVIYVLDEEFLELDIVFTTCVECIQGQSAWSCRSIGTFWWETIALEYIPWARKEAEYWRICKLLMVCACIVLTVYLFPPGDDKRTKWKIWKRGCDSRHWCFSCYMYGQNPRFKILSKSCPSLKISWYLRSTCAS